MRAIIGAIIRGLGLPTPLLLLVTQGDEQGGGRGQVGITSQAADENKPIQ